MTGSRADGLVRRLGLGAAAGALVAVVSWRGNRDPHLISVFPDGLTFLVLALLLAAAIRIDRRAGGGRRQMRADLTTAASAGVTLGAAVAASAAWRFTHPPVALPLFGVVTALAACVAAGAVVSAIAASGVPVTGADDGRA